MYRKYFNSIIFYLVFLKSCYSIQKAKDNGDIYIVNEQKFIEDIKAEMQTETSVSATDCNIIEWSASNFINFEDVISLCNSSFSIPMEYYIQFNTTAELPDVVDKTGMCFIRCLFEKSGLIENWKLNVAKIRQNIWPASGDSIDVCEKEGAEESNACVRTYAIAKCLILRSLVDARNVVPS